MKLSFLDVCFEVPVVQNNQLSQGNTDSNARYSRELTLLMLVLLSLVQTCPESVP
jgi:hypothetical protein